MSFVYWWNVLHIKRPSRPNIKFGRPQSACFVHMSACYVPTKHPAAPSQCLIVQSSPGAEVKRKSLNRSSLCTRLPFVLISLHFHCFSLSYSCDKEPSRSTSALRQSSPVGRHQWSWVETRRLSALYPAPLFPYHAFRRCYYCCTVSEIRGYLMVWSAVKSRF